MGVVEREYALGQSRHEYERLVRQGEFFRPMTQRFFQEAGIQKGMRVLDLGSGAGDVALLLSEMVGAEGEVIGVELDPGVIEFAQQRVVEKGAANITFVASDVEHYSPEGTFDAVVGRLILMYQKNPAAVLGKYVKHIRSGGVVAMMEPWLNPPAGPDSPVQRIVTCIVETLRRSGAHVDLGPRLHRVFASAGLHPPVMRFEAVADGVEPSPLFQLIGDSYKSLLPKAIEYGVPIAEGVDPEAVPGIFQATMSAVGYAPIVLPTMLAWSRVA